MDGTCRCTLGWSGPTCEQGASASPHAPDCKNLNLVLFKNAIKASSVQTVHWSANATIMHLVIGSLVAANALTVIMVLCVNLVSGVKF